MRKMAVSIMVALLCTVLFPIYGVNASEEMSTVRSMENENPNALKKLRYTDAMTGETSLIEINKTIGENVNNEQDRISKGNMNHAPRFVIGEDTRERIEDANTYPYSAIALVEVVYTNGKKQYGTGFMVSRRTMLTAAHVLVEKDWVIEEINVYKSCNGYKASPTAQASSWMICDEYDDTEILDCDNDYAIIRFSSNISQTWFGLYVPQNIQNLIGNGRHVAGYPGERCNVDTGYFPMYSAGGNVVDAHLYRIDHTIDTSDGESGGPVHRYNYSIYQWEAMAINVAGYAAYEGVPHINYGCRITSELYDWMLDMSYIYE